MERSGDSIKRYYAKKKKRNQRRKYAFYTVLTVFFVVTVTVLSLTVFFNISDIAVTNNAYYTADEIIAASGLEQGQNMFRLNKFKVIQKIKDSLPYLSEVTIDRHLPVGIEIIVTETKPYLALEQDGTCYILDETLKILQMTDALPEGLPLVTGLTVSEAVLGRPITAENGEDTRLYALTAALKERIGDGVVTAIDVTASYDVTFEYKGRVKVMVGTVDDIDKKLQLVKYVLDENRSNEQAEIDVTSGTRAFYRSVDNREKAPLETPEPTPEEN